MTDSDWATSLSANEEVEDEIVLCFYGVCLRQSDIDILDGPFWLNDQIITFAFEYFIKGTFLKSFVSEMAFVGPATVQLGKFLDFDDLSAELKPLEWPTKSLLFFPVNNNNSSQETGGTHWSLLVYRKHTDSFHYYNSLKLDDDCDTRTVFKIIVGEKRMLRKEQFETVPCPQQENGYDCGVFVIAFAYAIAEAYANGMKDFTNMSLVDQDAVSQTRRGLKLLIRILIKNFHGRTNVLGKQFLVVSLVGTNCGGPAKATAPTFDHASTQKRTLLDNVLTKTGQGYYAIG